MNRRHLLVLSLVAIALILPIANNYFNTLPLDFVWESSPTTIEVWQGDPFKLTWIYARESPGLCTLEIDRTKPTGSNSLIYLDTTLKRIDIYDGVMGTQDIQGALSYKEVTLTGHVIRSGSKTFTIKAKIPEPTYICDRVTCSETICGNNGVMFGTKCVADNTQTSGYRCDIDYTKVVSQCAAACGCTVNVCEGKVCPSFECYANQCYQVACTNSNGVAACTRTATANDYSCQVYLGKSCAPPVVDDCGAVKCTPQCFDGKAYYTSCVGGACTQHSLKEDCTDARWNYICEGYSKYATKCASGACVKGALLQANSPDCGYDSCAGVACPESKCDGAAVVYQFCRDGACAESYRSTCTSICVGADEYSTKCSSGKCVKDALVASNSPKCVDACIGVNCGDKCVGSDLYAQYCFNGQCYTAAMKEKCATQCGCYDKCAGVTCSEVCVGTALYNKVCTDGQCVKGTILSECSVACGCEQGDPNKDSDGDTIIDSKDACINIKGVNYDNQWSGYNGCPDPDGDGVPNVDNIDMCPDKKGRLSDGCPVSAVCTSGVVDAIYNEKSIATIELSTIKAVNVELKYQNPTKVKSTTVYVGDSQTPSYQAQGAISAYDFPVTNGEVKGRIVTQNDDNCTQALTIFASTVGDDGGGYTGYLIWVSIILVVGFILLKTWAPRKEERLNIDYNTLSYAPTKKKDGPGRPRIHPPKMKVPGRKPGRPTNAERAAWAGYNSRKKKVRR